MFKNPIIFMNNGDFTRTHNPFKNIIKCFVCHKNGHISSKCPLKGCGPSSQNRFQTNSCLQWKKKLNKCDLALIAQDQKSQWYFDSGCSKHMTGDRRKFATFDEKKSGNVTFGNDRAGKIKGKGLVRLSNGRGEAQDVIFVDGLKANLLSVSQICDKGCEVLFRAQYCEEIGRAHV